MAQTELKIQITTAADTAGANATANALNNVKKQTNEAGKGAKELARSLGQSNEIGGAAVTMFTSLEAASRGGAAGIAGTANAIRSFVQILRGAIASSGPIAIGIAILGTLGAAAFALRDKFRAGGSGAEEMKKKIEDANKAKLDGLQKEMENLAERTNDAIDSFKRLQAGLAEVREERLKADLAAIQGRLARGEITEEEAKKQSTALERAEVREKLIERESEAVVTAGKLARQAREAEEIAERSRQELEGATTLQQQLADAEERVSAARRGVLAAAGAPQEVQARALENLRAAREELAPLRERAGTDEQLKTLIADLTASLEKNVAAAETAAKLADEAAKTNAQTRETILNKLPEIERREREEDRAKPLPPASEEQIKQARQLGSTVISNRILQGIPVDLSAARAAFPDFRFPEGPATRDTAAPGEIERGASRFRVTPSGERRELGVEETTEGLKEATEAQKNAPDFSEAARAAQELGAAATETAARQQEVNAAAAAALQETIAMQRENAAMIAKQAQMIVAQGRQIAQLSSQMAAQRTRAAAA